MKHNLVITIGRQYGSGGRSVGMLLAKKLGIEYYDKELISEASKISGICSEVLKKEDEKLPGSFSHALSSISVGFFSQGLTTENIYKIQADAILGLAQKTPCVIVGRSADYILRNNPICFNVFIHAPEDVRLQRVMARTGLDAKKAAELMQKTNKGRAAFYNFYTDKKWGDSASYHLSIDSSMLGIEKTADAIYCLIEEFMESQGGSFATRSLEQ